MRRLGNGGSRRRRGWRRFGCDRRSGKGGRRVNRLGQTLEDWNVGAGRELDADLIAVAGIVIILSEAFADFAGGDSNDRIGVGVVAGRAAEDVHADGTLFDLIGVALQSLFDDEAQQGGITFALEEKRVDEEQFKLGQDGCFIRLRLRHPWLQGGPRGTGAGNSSTTGL